MKIFSGIFQRAKFARQTATTSPTRHFLRITSPLVDELFQINANDAVRATEAQDECGFFQFKTLKGRRCAVNLRLIQAIQLFEAPGEIVSTKQIRGVLIHLTGRSDAVDIEPNSTEEVSEFFQSLESDGHSAKLGDWHFQTAELVIAVASETFEV